MVISEAANKDPVAGDVSRGGWGNRIEWTNQITGVKGGMWWVGGHYGAITPNDAEDTRVVLEMADRPLVGVRFSIELGIDSAWRRKWVSEGQTNLRKHFLFECCCHEPVLAVPGRAGPDPAPTVDT